MPRHAAQLPAHDHLRPGQPPCAGSSTTGVQVMLLGEDDRGPWTEEDPDREMRISTDIPLAQLLADYEQQCARSRELVASLDLDTLSKKPISTGQPVTLRWNLFHLIEETARHKGHLCGLPIWG
jgi:hypothetical protein